MKPNDPNEAQVWQRVLSQEHAPQSLQTLMVQLKQDIHFLKHRIKNGGAVTDLLIREYTDQYLTLKGIALHSGSKFPGNVIAPPGHSLQICYEHALQRLTAWQLRISDPTYGPVFRCLAQQTEHHCQKLLQLSAR